MDRLPSHVVLSIVQYAVAKPDPRINVLSVCTDFYLAAIPILYHSPKLVAHYDSFFLHTNRTAYDCLPASILKLSNTESIKAGHTKVAALRYVRNLHIVLPWASSENEPSPSSVLSIGAADEASSEEALWEARANLRGLPSGIMPLLGGVCVTGGKKGPSALSEYGMADMAAALFFHALLSLSPSYWCQTHADITPLTRRISEKIREIEDWRPPILYLHIRSVEDFQCLLGGTTFLYIHNNSGDTLTPDPPSRSSLEAMTRWFGGGMRSMLWQNPYEESDPEESREIYANTKIVVAGLFPPAHVLPGIASLSVVDGTPHSSGSVYDEVRSGEHVVKPVRDAMVKALPGGMGLQIEVRRAADMPECPGCGRGD